MTDHRARIVKRVVQSLEETRDPEALVWDHFDADRDVLIEATRETLAATREDAPRAKVADTLERELIEALRWPADVRPGVLPRLYVHRGRVAGAAALLAAVGAALLMVLV